MCADFDRFGISCPSSVECALTHVAGESHEPVILFAGMKLHSPLSLVSCFSQLENGGFDSYSMIGETVTEVSDSAWGESICLSRIGDNNVRIIRASR